MCTPNPVVLHDCELIVEAIRRLQEGTWNLETEDLDLAHILLPQILTALKDHIAIEEATLFPELDAKARAAHQQEHSHLLAILWSAEKALIDQNSMHFRSLLSLLSERLNQHHQQGHHCHPFSENCDRTLLPSIDSLSKRFKRTTLESQ